MGYDPSNLVQKVRRVSDPVSAALLRLFDSLTEFDEEEAHNEAKDVAQEAFQQKFGERALVYPLISIALVAIVGVIDFILCWSLSNQMYGLSLDLLGAIILGRGLLMGGVAIGAVGSSNVGYNSLLVKSMAKDSVDGVWGVFLLLFGLLIQIIAVAGFAISVPSAMTAFNTKLGY